MNVHLIGHSLGAHVCGLVGKKLKPTGFLLERVSGLDPAGPGFEFPWDWYDSLSRDSASFVDVIHTSRFMGHNGPLGHLDFYPNNGQNQPCCQVNFDVDQSDDAFFSFLYQNATVYLTEPRTCSHYRGYMYYIESILDQSLRKSENGQFRAVTCTKYDSFL